jgi:dTDP-4-amino-4,6-dideoxygalactose transaminase
MALALRAAGIGGGDFVLCPALGCAAPVQGIAIAGARPVFVDVNPNTYAIDPFCAEYVLSRLKRRGEAAKALIAVDIFGAPCNYQELGRICAERDVVLIEDLSEAFGARLSGIATGNFGRFSVASFSGGDIEEPGGGAVFCRNESDALRVASLRSSAKRQFLGGRGAAMPCMSAADTLIVSERLGSCQGELKERERLARRYKDRLPGAARAQQLLPEAESAHTRMVVALPGDWDREAVSQRLRALNIPAAGHGRGHQTGYCDWNRRMLPRALSLNERLISLPIHPHLGEHAVDYICEGLTQALNG